MPTINQLIRKGREKITVQVYCADTAELPAKARRVPVGQDLDS